jgi:hypothetical protein
MDRAFAVLFRTRPPLLKEKNRTPFASRAKSRERRRLVLAKHQRPGYGERLPISAVPDRRVGQGAYRELKKRPAKFI